MPIRGVCEFSGFSDRNLMVHYWHDQQESRKIILDNRLPDFHCTLPTVAADNPNSLPRSPA